MPIAEFYWRLAVFADPGADKPVFSEAFENHAELRRVLVFEHGLDRSYVEHGLMIADSNPANSAKTGVGFEFCKARDEKGGQRISWLAQITKIRRFQPA